MRHGDVGDVIGLLAGARERRQEDRLRVAEDEEPLGTRHFRILAILVRLELPQYSARVLGLASEGNDAVGSPLGHQLVRISSAGPIHHQHQIAPPPDAIFDRRRHEELIKGGREFLVVCRLAGGARHQLFDERSLAQSDVLLQARAIA